MENPYASKRWLKFYDKHVPEKLTYPDKLYTDLFNDAVSKSPNAVAVNYAGEEITYAEFDTLTNKFANFLKEQGLKQGDVVGISLPNVMGNYISIVGTLKAGCVVSGCSPLLTPRELEFQLNNSGAKALVAFDMLWEKVSPAVGKTGVKTIALVRITDFLPAIKKILGKLLKKIPNIEVKPVPGIRMHDFMDILKTASPAATVLKMDTNSSCLLQYTGGTTGVPKGAILTHKNFVSQVTQYARWFDIQPGKEVVMSAFPMFHMAGLALSLLTMAAGGKSIAVPNPRDIAGLIKSLKKHKPTIFCNVPTIYMELLKLPDFNKVDFSNLKCFISGASAMPAEHLKKLEALAGQGKFVEVMGMTETSPVTLGGPLYGKKKVGSVGVPWPDTEVKVVDPETKELVPVGEPGELVAKGPQVFTRGYLNMPEETAKTLKDGWIYTGDIIRMDEEGYFFMVDRAKDMVNVSGFKVFTRELDDLIIEHPDVAMAATIGTPNPERPGTEIVTSAIVLKPGVEKSDATRDRIIEFLRQNVSPYKVPKKIMFMDELPMSAVGKILKRELRDMLK
jgi:acyl-CoA synthetase (AMP-forming)/AMP-acid ligase II